MHHDDCQYLPARLALLPAARQYATHLTHRPGDVAQSPAGGPAYMPSASGWPSLRGRSFSSDITAHPTATVIPNGASRRFFFRLAQRDLCAIPRILRDEISLRPARLGLVEGSGLGTVTLSGAQRWSGFARLTEWRIVRNLKCPF